MTSQSDASESERSTQALPKKIVVLSDGTGNSSAKVWRTNVWRTFEFLDLTGSDQVAMYDDGVGTSSFLPLAILGGAFGWGLKRNVIELYKFICRNYPQASANAVSGRTCRSKLRGLIRGRTAMLCRRCSTSPCLGVSGSARRARRVQSESMSRKNERVRGPV